MSPAPSVPAAAAADPPPRADAPTWDATHVGRVLSVVLHDVAPPHWTACERILRGVRSVAGAELPLTLLAVPRYQMQRPPPMFEQWLDSLRREGHELALHGYTHRDDGVPEGWRQRLVRNWYTAGEGEFAALSELDALLRLRQGQLWFERNRWPLDGFVAPAWLLSPGTWTALRQVPLRYTCTLGSLVLLPHGQRVHSQSLVYSTRSRWRRAASCGWNRLAAAVQQRRRLLRLELHPGDVAHAGVQASWMRLLERALRDRTALTLRDAARVVGPVVAAAPRVAATV